MAKPGQFHAKNYIGQPLHQGFFELILEQRSGTFT